MNTNPTILQANANLKFQLRDAAGAVALNTELFSMAFGLAGIDLSYWDCVYAEEVTIAHGASHDVNLNSFTNLANEAGDGMSKILGFMIRTTGADIVYDAHTPATPLEWPTGNGDITSGGVGTLAIGNEGKGGAEFHFDDPTSIGYPVSAAHCKFRLYNNDYYGGIATVTIVVIGAR